MSDRMSCEIICTACGADTWVIRQSVYEGFTKVGDAFECAACGHRYASMEAVPFKAKPSVDIFDASDRTEQPHLFEEGENRAICRYCAQYVINPFTQWCGVHKKEVEATDTCGQFTAKEADPPTPLGG